MEVHRCSSASRGGVYQPEVACMKQDKLPAASEPSPSSSRVALRASLVDAQLRETTLAVSGGPDWRFLGKSAGGAMGLKTLLVSIRGLVLTLMAD